MSTAPALLEAIFDSVVRSLRSGDKIEIRGFGSFRTRQRQARIGRNPKTGARVEVPSKRIPYFKPSKELKDLVNGQTNGAVPARIPLSHRHREGLPREALRHDLRRLRRVREAEPRRELRSQVGRLAWDEPGPAME